MVCVIWRFACGREVSVFLHGPCLAGGELGELLELVLDFDEGCTVCVMQSFKSVVCLPSSGEAAEVHVFPVRLAPLR